MLSVRTCSDACALLTLYAYDELTQHACEICSDDNNRAFCETGAFGDSGLVTEDFPFSASTPCDAYDELRNCIFARFGYTFSKPKWQKRFGGLPWYRRDPAFNPAKLPPVVKANVQKLKELATERRGCE
jgi:hypothetical protein